MSTRPQRRWLRRSVLGVTLTLVLAAVAFFTLAPGIVERGMNEIADRPLPAVSPEAQRLHSALAVADLHSDTLMWDRSLNTRSDRGHVDLPRLREGNVALQVFSSVSKSPKGQNYDSNTADTDNITLLSFAQLQPPRTWFSLLERSRFHAQKLRENAQDSDGTLRTITTGAELETLLADRASGQDVTGGLFSVEGLQNLEGASGTSTCSSVTGCAWPGSRTSSTTRWPAPCTGSNRAGSPSSAGTPSLGWNRSAS